jgi:hypothetical protein
MYNKKRGMKEDRNNERKSGPWDEKDGAVSPLLSELRNERRHSWRHRTEYSKQSGVRRRLIVNFYPLKP